MGHSNFGSTPHSKRMCRLRLCGRAYELPHCLHMNMLLFDAFVTAAQVPVVVAVVAAAAADAALDALVADAAMVDLRGDVRSPACVSKSVFKSNKFGGDLVASTGSDNSFKHVAGVSKRKSHG